MDGAEFVVVREALGSGAFSDTIDATLEGVKWPRLLGTWSHVGHGTLELFVATNTSKEGWLEEWYQCMVSKVNWLWK